MEKTENITVEVGEEKRVKLEVIGEEVITTIQGKDHIIYMFEEWDKLRRHNLSKKHTYLPNMTFEDGVELTWNIILKLLRSSETEKISEVKELRYFLIDSINNKFSDITDKYTEERVDQLYDFFSIVI